MTPLQPSPSLKDLNLLAQLPVCVLELLELVLPRRPAVRLELGEDARGGYVRYPTCRTRQWRGCGLRGPREGVWEVTVW